MYPANARELWTLHEPFYRLSDELVKLESFDRPMGEGRPWRKGLPWPASWQSVVLGSSWSLPCMASHGGLLGVGF